jgi:hypothetical protein
MGLTVIMIARDHVTISKRQLCKFAANGSRDDPP